MTFRPFQSGVTGWWYVAKRWPKSYHRHSCEVLIYCCESEQEAADICAELRERLS